MIGPDIINSLFYRVERKVETIPFQILEFTLSSCPHLDELTIVCNRSDIQFVGEAHYDSCYEFKIQQSRKPITKIGLNGAIVTQDILNIFSKYLPDMESLVCMGNSVIDLFSQGSNITFDMSGLKKLKNVEFNAENVTQAELDNMFIRFVYYSSNDQDNYDVSREGKDENDSESGSSLGENEEGDYIMDPSSSITQVDRITCSPATVNFVNECIADGARVRSITFVCHSRIGRFVAQYGSFLNALAIFNSGQLYDDETPPSSSKFQPVDIPLIFW